MSRVGNKPVQIPAGVEVKVVDGGRFGYKEVIVNGGKGELRESLRPGVDVSVADNQVTVVRANEMKQNKAFHGLYRSLIANMVEGVTNGYKKELHIEGIGYRAQLIGEAVELSLGYSHKILLKPPVGVKVNVVDQTEIMVEGIDKQLVGQFADKIRSQKKPEPYKGKGVRYKDEQIVRKDTKSSKK